MAERAWPRLDQAWFLLPSLRRALSDTVTYHWLRTVMTIAVAVVAAFIASITTHSHSAWWAVLAAPIVLVPTYLVMFSLNFGGWNRRWMSDSKVQSDGMQLQLHLEPRDRTVKFGGPEVDCWVHSPGGETFRHLSPGAQSIRGQYYAHYPVQFPQAPPLAPGMYKVIWVEQTPRGRWREIVTNRVTVGPRL